MSNRSHHAVFVLFLLTLGTLLGGGSVATADDEPEAFPLRWWEDPAIVPPSPRLVANYAHLCDLSPAQFQAWLLALREHAAAVDALTDDARAGGPIMFPADATEIERLELSITAGERQAGLRRRVEGLRDELLAAFLLPLSEVQREHGVAWRNLVLLREELLAPELNGASRLAFVGLEDVLSEIDVTRADAMTLGALVSATADDRRAIAVDLGTGDGGFRTREYRAVRDLLVGGMEYGDAYHELGEHPSPAMQAGHRTMRRYQRHVLDAIGALQTMPLAPGVREEAIARILARAEANLSSAGNVIAGAAETLAGDLDPAIRTELEALTETALAAAIAYVTEHAAGIVERPREVSPERRRALRDRLNAVNEPSSALAAAVRAQGGSFPSLPMASTMMRGVGTPGTGAAGDTPRWAARAAISAAARALAGPMGWTDEQADAVGESLATSDSALVPGPGAGDQTLVDASAALLRGIAGSERWLEYAEEAPGRWAALPLSVLVLRSATAEELTPELFAELLRFETARRSVAAIPTPEDQAAAMFHAPMADAVTAALAGLEQTHPRLGAAVATAIDESRIPWMLTRHRELAAILEAAATDFGLDPALAADLVEAGRELRAVARQVDEWIATGTDDARFPSAARLRQPFADAERVFNQRALLAEVVRHDQQRR
jgi:hypothetical protein